MHSTLDTLVSSGGSVLHNVSIVWSVKILLELEQEVDPCCVIVWCIAEWKSTF